MTSQSQPTPIYDGKFCSLLKEIYGDYRTVFMNEKYYRYRLTRFRNYNLAYEIALAIGASSTIAAWSIFHDWAAGKKLWAVYSGLVALLAILKPILQIPSQIERYSKLHVGYKDLFYDLDQMVDDIRAAETITEEMLKTRAAAKKRYKDLALQDETNVSRKLLEKCFNEVLVEKSVEDFWYPEPCKQR